MLIIANPRAGTADKASDLKVFDEYEPEVYETTGKDDLRAIRSLLKKEKHDVVVTIGGDGTVHLATQAIVGTTTKLAIIPRGSSNSLFKELTDEERPLEKREERRIDVIDIDGTYCLHLAGFGLNAKVVKQTRKHKKRGIISYAKALIKTIIKHNKARYLVDGKKVETSLLVIANGKGYQGTITINPEGKVDDGYFEVCTLRDLEEKETTMIDNLDEEAFHIDGEYKGHPKRVGAKIRPKALRLLL